MDFGTGAKRNSKKSTDVLDDLLGDLLSDESPTRKKSANSTPTRQRPGSGKGGKPGGKDENFYSSLAAMADSDGGSDISEADVGKMAVSLGGLDDMDADLFGDSLTKKNSTGRSNGKPTTPRRTTPRSKGSKSPTRVQSPTRSETPTSPPGSARGSLKRKPVKPKSPTSTPATNPLVASPPQAQPDHKPGTAPGKMTDLSSASESLIPGQKTSQRPETAPKLKKKYDFGDFDPDDPLAGVLSDVDVDVSDSDRPRSATRRSGTAAAQAVEEPPKSVQKSSPLDSPRRHGLMDRPPTRSGSNAADFGSPDANTSADLDSGPAKSGTKTQGGGIFSDSDGDFLDGLGLEGKGGAPSKKSDASQKAKTGDNEELRPARSVFDSLLGKGSTAAQLLEPKEKKQFVLDSKYSGSQAGSNGKDEEDDFQFGSYQPSVVTSSRPNSRRSVRFQDDDDIFGLESRPSPRAKSPGAKTKPPPDMEWLEMAAKTTTPAASVAAMTSAPASVTPTATAATTSGNTNITAAKPPAPTSSHCQGSGSVIVRVTSSIFNSVVQAWSSER